MEMYLEVPDRTTFAHLDLVTRPGAVMTPRATSEALVERALAALPHGGVAADVGTGSGAVAIALAAAAPTATVWATDTSPAAVALARENALRHGVCNRVLVRRGDLLAPVMGALDVVV